MVQLFNFSLRYLWAVLESWLGITLLVLGVLQLGEWALGKKIPIPTWLRLAVFAILLFLAQGVVYKKLSDNPPVVLRTPAPPAPQLLKEERPKATPTAPSKPTLQINNAPSGIAIGGGTVTNPTVNNFGLPDRRLTQSQIIALETSARIVCPSLPPIRVTAANGNQEAQRYALDFVSALRAGECKADLALPIPGLTADVTGVLIGVRDQNNLDSAAQALKGILSAGGIPFSVAPMKADFFPGEKSVLVIGARE
jgi:hypothetical protein